MQAESSKPLGAWSTWLLLACLAVALIFAANAGHQAMMANASRDAAQQQLVHAMGLTEPAPKGLAPRFTDSAGRLLADPPSDASQLVDPSVIVVAHLDSSDPETPNIDWNAFEAHLAQATGRKVVDQAFDNGPDQMVQISQGKLTLVALHAADAPFLVNNYGYQPAAVLGDESGANGNHLDIVVPAKSPINSLSDLRGRTLVCTLPSSITGYRAAVTLLMNDAGLQPNVDYTITWSLGQKKSITGVAASQYEAAAISDDKLQSLLEKGDVTTSSYRIIYQSQVIPRTTIGWFYNLKPELAAQLKEAILSFQPKASDQDEKPLHFIAINYKKDFQTVRQIDDQFDPRLDAKTKGHGSASAAAG
ncbi:MAG TPA: PhnD/SsuA/transferrin family substrate-binding protein [Tepidisphaeraceae bacterium]|nr:PhnD/SsuA/transferrin family substrate-binding protein [Tepidisphaeraceae bacterium]